MTVLSGVMLAAFAATAPASAATITKSAGVGGADAAAASTTLDDAELKERLGRMVDQAEAFTPVTGAGADAAKQQAQSGLSAGDVKLLGFKGKALQWDGATVTENADHLQMVRVPAAQAKEDRSSATFIIEATGKLSLVEYKFSPMSETAMRMQLWAAGALQMDKVADSANRKVVDSALWTAANPSADFSWSRFNNCLASQGIAWTTVALLSTACGVACAITLGAGCAVCISAAGSISITVVYHCLRVN